MWHASAAGSGGRPHRLELRARAFAALAGVGDRRAGEWVEWTGYAFHVRRRLTTEEQAAVGEALDCRQTAEGLLRLKAIADVLPERALAMAAMELGEG